MSAPHRWTADDGTTLAARLSGTPGRPAVLLLSGGPGFVNYLPDAVDGFPALAVAPDPRGVGASGGGPHGVAQALSDLEALRRSLDADAWVVVGHSSGADLGLAYAAEHPGSVRRLFALCGTGLQDDRRWHKEYEAAQHREPDLDIPYDADVHRALLDDWRRWIRSPELFEALRRVRAEVVVLAAEHDVRPSWPLAQLASLFRGRLRVLPGTGHDVWHERPDLWWEVVREAAESPPAEHRPDPATEARQRLEVLEPLTTVLADPVRFVATLADADDDAEAGRRLREEHGVTELGATAALDVQARLLTRQGLARLVAERDLLRERARGSTTR